LDPVQAGCGAARGIGRGHRRACHGRPSRAAGAPGGRPVSAQQATPRALMDYLRLAADYLGRCGSPSARLDAEVLLGHVLGMDRVALYVNHDQPLEPAEVDAYRAALRARCQGTPVAYITGKKEFLGMTLAVNRHVLIPRPETELLVEAVVRRLADAAGKAGPGAPLLIADVGTGSGAIALGIARALPHARLLAVDVSPGALAVARENAAAHGLQDRVVLLEGDLLAPVAQELTQGPPAAGGTRPPASWTRWCPTRLTSPPGTGTSCPGRSGSLNRAWRWTAAPTAWRSTGASFPRPPPCSRRGGSWPWRSATTRPPPCRRCWRPPAGGTACRCSGTTRAIP